MVCALGFRVRVPRPRWSLVVGVKHPAMAGHEGEVRLALEEPDEVRRSRQDATVYLFYRVESAGRWVCAVVKQLDQDGFLITAYPTDAIKAGELVWGR